MNQQAKKILFLLLIAITNAQAMHEETTDAGPSEQTAGTISKKRHHRNQRKIAQKEREIEQESARFGATQPDSESDSPEGFLHGESN